jgi:hypothetical protein
MACVPFLSFPVPLFSFLLFSSPLPSLSVLTTSLHHSGKLLNFAHIDARLQEHTAILHDREGLLEELRVELVDGVTGQIESGN